MLAAGFRQYFQIKHLADWRPPEREKDVVEP